MKKMIIGIAILIQCISVGAMENQRQNAVNSAGTAELVPAGFFDAGIARMNENIQNAVRTVSADRGALPNEITTLSTDYRSYFEGLRSQINSIYFQQMQVQQQHQEAVVNEMTRERHAEFNRIKSEIQQMRTRLNELATSTHTQVVNLGDIDEQIRNLEIILEGIRNRAVTVSVSELFSEGDFSDRADVFDRQLSDMSTSINVDGNSVDSAFDATQAVYNASVNTLALNIQRGYNESVVRLIDQFDEHKRLLEQGYTQAISSLGGTVQRLTEENTRLERKLELMNLVNAAISSNYLLAGRPLIRTRGADVKAISDFLQRKSTMEDLYNKFRAFSNLYGRRDLGVVAIPSDLEAVKVWVDRTQMSNITSRYGSFPADSCPKMGYVPNFLSKSFKGVDIGCSLNQAKSRLETQLSRLTSTEANLARGELSSIFQKSSAENEVSMWWDHPTFYGHYSHNEIFTKSGVQEGKHFQEMGGGWWRDNEGFVAENTGGEFHGKAPNGRADIDAVDIWNCYFVTRYNKYLDETKQALMQRAILLFDFETNPESNLQKAYRQAGITSSLVIPFPLIEIDRLINQYNEFMRM